MESTMLQKQEFKPFSTKHALITKNKDLREMLRERLIRSFCRWEKIQKILLNFSPFQNWNKIIKAVVNQILLKEVSHKWQN